MTTKQRAYLKGLAMTMDPIPDWKGKYEPRTYAGCI